MILLLIALLLAPFQSQNVPMCEVDIPPRLVPCPPGVTPSTTIVLPVWTPPIVPPSSIVPPPVQGHPYSPPRAVETATATAKAVRG